MVVHRKDSTEVRRQVELSAVPGGSPYPGPDVTFPAMLDPPRGVVMRVTIDRLGGPGPWAAPRA